MDAKERGRIDRERAIARNDNGRAIRDTTDYYGRRDSMNTDRYQTSWWGADTYTLYLNGAPIEIWAQGDDDARRIAGGCISRAAQVDTWELRRDRDDACIGRGKTERYVAKGWKASADSPLRGPF